MNRTALAIPLLVVAIGATACGGTADNSGSATTTAAGSPTAGSSEPFSPEASAQTPQSSESPGPTASTDSSVPPFNPICGDVSSPEKYVVGEWVGNLSDEARDDRDRIVFTEDCQVMENENIDYNAPDGEWSQRGGNVRFVLTMNLDDPEPNMYKGSLNADGTTLTGTSRNGVFQFTRVIPGAGGADASGNDVNVPEGDQAAVAADFARQWESLVTAESRARVCEVYRDSPTVQDSIAMSSLAELEERGTLSVGTRQQYEIAAIDYFLNNC